MEALFNIMSYSIGNLFLGILLTIIGIALMFILIRSWFTNSIYTPISYIVGCILFLFLSFQSILLCGAVTIKSYSDDIEAGINSWVKDIPSETQFDKESSQQILVNISKEWPLVGYFIGDANFTGHTPLTIAQSMTQELRSFMNKFILRRIGWSLLFVVAGAFLVIKTMEQTKRRQYSKSRSSGVGSKRRRYED